MIDHGLKQKQLELIKDILKQFAPSIDGVYLFGSRANETYKSYSDIDLVIYGKLSEKMMDRLWTCFYESSLPYKVDINAYHLVNYPPLKEYIDQNKKLLFSKNQLISLTNKK